MVRATITLVAILSSACGMKMSPSTKRVLIGGGAAVATAGVFVARPTPVDSDHDGVNDWALNDDYSGLLPGALMVAGGLAMLIAGLSSEPAVESPAAPPVAIPAPAAGTASTTTLSPPSLPLATSPERARLPELPATPEVLRLAMQVRNAASNGHCDAAWLMWGKLQVRDVGYALALRAGPVMTSCPPPR